MIVVVDYGMGNNSSIIKMVKKIGYDCIASSSPEVLTAATCLILPGVGNFAKAISILKQNGLFELLNKLALIEKKPIIGICLGMQLMTLSSQEGDIDGFGWISARVKKINGADQNGHHLMVPHMGWNNVSERSESELLHNMPHGVSRFYFVHSYYVDCDNSKDIWLETVYGSKFCSAFYKDNLIGLQFHPEKSHRYGMTLLKNIIENVTCKEIA